MNQTQRIAVFGSKTFKDYKLLEMVLNTHVENSNISELVYGSSDEIGMLINQYAKAYDVVQQVVLVDRKRYGNSAIYVNNTDIINTVDKVIVFWDENCKDMQHVIKTSEKYRKDLLVIEFKA